MLSTERHICDEMYNSLKHDNSKLTNKLLDLGTAFEKLKEEHESLKIQYAKLEQKVEKYKKIIKKLEE
jgi:peptidoglycan hydrolase CwlO-like protein